jgi:hypothetical protein
MSKRSNFMVMKNVSMCAFLALVCSFACISEDEANVAEPTEEQAIGEPDADDFRASWECAGGELITSFTSDYPRGFLQGRPDPFYCLTQCVGHNQVSRASSEAVRDPSQRTESWCLARAADYCAKVRRELEGWCWGMRD